MPAYNGHKNWNHWNVSLWINNDEGLYRLAQSCRRRTNTKRDAARVFVDMMRAHNKPGKTPDGAPYSVSAVAAAMDWS